MCEGDDIRASSYGLSPGQVQQVFTQRGLGTHLHVKNQHTVLPPQKAAFCLFNVVEAEGAGLSFSPVNVCESLNLPY